MSAAEQLLAALRDASEGRKRVTRVEIWRAFQESVRGYLGDADARPRLAALLLELEQNGQLAQPRTKKRWDQSAEPPLPHWVELTVAAKVAEGQRDHRSIAWPAPMVFISELRTVGNLDELLAIRRFLAERADAAPRVPVRERSLELFGDEKRLDSLLKSALFRPGRLSLELLRCRDVAPPLTFEIALQAASKRVLILENLHSYDSFRRYNRQSGAYRAVAYGHGSEFYATVRDLPRLREELGVSTLEYFGDLDAMGLEIACAANLWLATLGLALVPATRWYAELLDCAEARRLSGDNRQASGAALSWLPAELRQRTETLLAEGYRAPQELIGWERLSGLLEQ